MGEVKPGRSGTCSLAALFSFHSRYPIFWCRACCGQSLTWHPQIPPPILSFFDLLI